MENLKKEDVCLDVSTPEKHKEVIELLQKYGEEIYTFSIDFCSLFPIIFFKDQKVKWVCRTDKKGTLITIQKLEEILKEERRIEPAESIETLTENFKSKAKELGFKVDVVFEEIDPRIGMFGKFWDEDKNRIIFEVLRIVEKGVENYPFVANNLTSYENFQPFTQSEIKELTKNNPK